MSATQTNFELNRIYDEVKQMGLIKNTQNIFILVLVYTVIITTMLSALFGGVVMQSYYGIEFIFSKTKEYAPKVYRALSKFCELLIDTDNYNTNISTDEKPVKKPLIDNTWCNVSVKNIINYENKVLEAVSEADLEEESEAEDTDLEEESEVENKLISEAVSEAEDLVAEVEEEILSLKKIEDLHTEEILN